MRARADQARGGGIFSLLFPHSIIIHSFLSSSTLALHPFVCRLHHSILYFLLITVYISFLFISYLSYLYLPAAAAPINQPALTSRWDFLTISRREALFPSSHRNRKFARSSSRAQPRRPRRIPPSAPRRAFILPPRSAETWVGLSPGILIAAHLRVVLHRHVCEKGKLPNSDCRAMTMTEQMILIRRSRCGSARRRAIVPSRTLTGACAR